MANTFIYGATLDLSHSKCFTCAHRLRRVLEPEDLAEYDITDEMLENEGIDPDGGIVLEQHTCILCGLDLDGSVVECSHYKDKRAKNLFGFIDDNFKNY